jgi:MFS family permease
MGIAASLTLAGALTAFFFLPETFRAKEECAVEEESPGPVVVPVDAKGARMASAIALLGVHRLTIPGILSPTLGLLVLETVGGSIILAGMSFGVATLTGLGLGVSYLVSMVAAPVMGRLSDRAPDRWRVAAGGLVPGVAGFILLALASPAWILLGLPLTAFAGGSNQGLSTALVGDLSPEGQRGRKMGILFTVGDLTSAVGPLLAYALIPVLGLRVIYILSGAVMAIMMLVALGWAVRSAGAREISRGGA